MTTQAPNEVTLEQALQDNRARAGGLFKSALKIAMAASRYGFILDEDLEQQAFAAELGKVLKAFENKDGTISFGRVKVKDNTFTAKYKLNESLKDVTDGYYTAVGRICEKLAAAEELGVTFPKGELGIDRVWFTEFEESLAKAKEAFKARIESQIAKAKSKA